MWNSRLPECMPCRSDSRIVAEHPHFFRMKGTFCPWRKKESIKKLLTYSWENGKPGWSPCFKGYLDADRERVLFGQIQTKSISDATDIAESLREEAMDFWISDNRFGTV